MTIYCAAKYCCNNQKTQPLLSFFLFPRDKSRCHTWLTNAMRMDLLDKMINTNDIHCSFRLCSLHFEPEMMVKQKPGSRRLCLLADAVPTRFRDEPHAADVPQNSSSQQSNGRKRNSNGCAVRSCTNKFRDTNLHFFKFPHDVERSKIWAKNADREDILDKTPWYYTLCSDHFAPHCIERHGNLIRLTMNAVPTIFRNAEAKKANDIIPPAMFVQPRYLKGFTKCNITEEPLKQSNDVVSRIGCMKPSTTRLSQSVDIEVSSHESESENTRDGHRDVDSIGAVQSATPLTANEKQGKSPGSLVVATEEKSDDCRTCDPVSNPQVVAQEQSECVIDTSRHNSFLARKEMETSGVSPCKKVPCRCPKNQSSKPTAGSGNGTTDDGRKCWCKVRKETHDQSAVFRKLLNKYRNRVYRLNKLNRKLVKQVELLKSSGLARCTLDDVVQALGKFACRGLAEFIRWQLRIAASNGMGRRYTNLEKEWSLGLYKISPKAYAYVSQTLYLPSRPKLQKLLKETRTQRHDPPQNDAEPRYGTRDDGYSTSNAVMRLNHILDGSDCRLHCVQTIPQGTIDGTTGVQPLNVCSGQVIHLPTDDSGVNGGIPLEQNSIVPSNRAKKAKQRNEMRICYSPNYTKRENRQFGELPENDELREHIEKHSDLDVEHFSPIQRNAQTKVAGIVPEEEEGLSVSLDNLLMNSNTQISQSSNDDSESGLLDLDNLLGEQS